MAASPAMCRCPNFGEVFTSRRSQEYGGVCAEARLAIIARTDAITTSLAMTVNPSG